MRSLAHGGYFLILFCAACLQAASVGYGLLLVALGVVALAVMARQKR